MRWRSAIRNHMKTMRSSESIDLGKRLLDRSLKDLGSSLRKVGKVRTKEALDEFGLNNTTELYEQIGLGERLAPLTARFLIGSSDEPVGVFSRWRVRFPPVPDRAVGKTVILSGAFDCLARRHSFS